MIYIKKWLDSLVNKKKYENKNVRVTDLTL